MIVSHHPPRRSSEFIDGYMGKAETSHTSHTPITLIKDSNHDLPVKNQGSERDLNLRLAGWQVKALTTNPQEREYVCVCVCVCVCVFIVLRSTKTFSNK